MFGTSLNSISGFRKRLSYIYNVDEREMRLEKSYGIGSEQWRT